MTEKTAPLLPCRTQLIPSVVDFYTALGFETTFLQTSPYAYAVVARGDVELQFFGMKEYDPAESYSGFYLYSDDVDGVHDAFRRGLKAAYGKIPTRGLPRIGPIKDMSYGVRQFLLTDPTGTSVRVGQPISEDQHHRPAPKEAFARALHMADLFVDSKEDLSGAAKIIDRALRLTDPSPTPVQLLRLLVLRGDIAQRLGDDGAAGELLARAAAVRLSDEERDSARDPLARLAELLTDGPDPLPGRPAAETGAGSESGAGAGAGSESGAGAGAGSESGAGAGAGSESGAGAGAGAGAGV